MFMQLRKVGIRFCASTGEFALSNLSS